MAGVRNFVTNPVAWTVAVLVAFYAASAHLAPVRLLSEAWIVGLIVASSSVMIAVGPIALRCFTSRGWPHPDDAVGLGMFLTAFGMFWLGLWSLFWRLSGQSGWVVNNDLYNAWRPFVIAGMLTKVTAIGVFGGNVPKGYKVRYGLILLLAAALILLIAWTRPDLRPIADWLRPYLEEVRSFGIAPAGERWHHATALNPPLSRHPSARPAQPLAGFFASIYAFSFAVDTSAETWSQEAKVTISACGRGSKWWQLSL